MAATDSELFPSTVGTFFNSAIRHGSIPDQIEMSTERELPGSSSKVGINQNGVFKIVHDSTDETSTTGIHLGQNGSSQISLVQRSLTQIGGEQVGLSQNRFYQTSLAQISSEQIGSSQISPAQIDLFKISSPQVNTSQISTFESSNLTINPISLAHFANNPQNFNPSKVALSGIVPSQQFISSDFPNHNLTSNVFSNLKYSATNIWSDLLNPETPLNITFQFANLLTGHLAEAQITSFDASGTPSAGTIFIDDDANGKGWFIDSTPLDNSEFTTT